MIDKAMSTTIALNSDQCQCQMCQQGEDHPEQEWHQHINLLMSRLDEQQRRWYAALEAKRLGHGGMTLMSEITGLHVNTIRRGRRELSKNLEDRPRGRVRLSGGGRKRLEKKTQNW
jgi:hypothetical protein